MSAVEKIGPAQSLLSACRLSLACDARTRDAAWLASKMTVVVAEDESTGMWAPAWRAGAPIIGATMVPARSVVVDRARFVSQLRTMQPAAVAICDALDRPTSTTSLLAVAGGEMAFARVDTNLADRDLARVEGEIDYWAAFLRGDPTVKANASINAARANLQSLTRPGALPHLDRAFASAVLIVGAGPTLDLGRVRAAHAAGVSVWTTNTAAKAVCSVVTPDLVSVAECLDVSDQLDGLAPRFVAASFGAHPNVWKRAGGFVMPITRCGAAAGLGVTPIDAGSAALIIAVSLAAAGGARWIGLEGVDLAFGRDGRGYSIGARYQQRLARVDGKTGTLEGGNEQRELAERSGQTPPPLTPIVCEVHARDGGPPLYAQGAWLRQIEWLEAFAASHRGIALHRGTGLADLVGWGDAPMPAGRNDFRVETRRVSWKRARRFAASL